MRALRRNRPARSGFLRAPYRHCSRSEHWRVQPLHVFRARFSRPAGFPRLRRPCPAIPNGRSTFDSSRPECANSGHCPTAWRFKSTQGRNSTESGPKFPRLTPLESKARVERAEGRVQRSFAVANSYSKTIDPASKPRDDRHPAGIVEGRRSCVSVSPLCCDRRSTPCGADSRPPAAHRLGLRRRRPDSILRRRIHPGT
jgi:hypothetical protein